MKKRFEVVSDEVLVVLGNSERAKTGELIGRTLVRHNYFKLAHIATLNQMDSKSKKGKEFRAMAPDMTVITHSAGIQYVDEALQIIAVNPPEQRRYVELLKGSIRMVKDPIIDEPGAHERNFADMVGATVEFLGSPITSVRTVTGIARGFSAVEHLINHAEAFPEGRAIIHSSRDAFDFQNHADLEKAERNGITTQAIGGFHTEFLFAPLGTMREIQQCIYFPQNGARTHSS